MALETLREIALQFSKVQPKQIDMLTEETPFLSMIPYAATHDMWHMDAPLKTVSSHSELVKFDLAKMGGMIEVAEDRARQYGSKEKYFADQTAPVLKKTGMNVEEVLLYHNLRKHAIDKSRSVYNAGGDGTGSSTKGYSIIAVRFEEGVCQGLYNPKGFGKGALFNTEPINYGGLYKMEGGVLGYGVRLKCDLGFMITGIRNSRAIVNIDPTLDNNKPKKPPSA